MGSYGMRLAAVLAAINVVIHIAALIFGGFVAGATLVIGTILWAALAYGFISGRRSVAWIGFFVALIGTVVAIGIMMDGSGLFRTIMTANIACDIAIAITLFTVLWKSPQPLNA